MTEPAKAAAPLRVLSYNVRGLRDDYPALVRVIRAAQPHLVFVQEAPILFRSRGRAADLARRCQLVVVGGDYAAGNLLMSSVAIAVHDVRQHLFPLRKGTNQRAAVIAKLSRLGHEFTAVGTHLSLEADERAQQVEQLTAEVADELDAGPMVLAGDLNEPPGGAVSRHLGERLVDVAETLGDKTGTFSTYAPGPRIDYVWTDSGTKASTYRVIDTPDARQGSDHFPIYAELELV